MRDLHDMESEHLAEQHRTDHQNPKREQLIKELSAHVKSQMSHAAYHSKPHEFIARWLLSDVIPLKDEHVAEGMVDAQTRVQAERARAKRAEAQLDDMVKQRDYYRDRYRRLIEHLREFESDVDYSSGWKEEYETWDSPTQPS